MNAHKKTITAIFVLVASVSVGLFMYYDSQKLGFANAVGATPTTQHAVTVEQVKSALDRIQERKWEDVVVGVYKGDKSGAVQSQLFWDKSRLAYTTKSRDDGRRMCIYIYNVSTTAASKLDLLSKEPGLTIKEFIISPSSQSIWVLVGPMREERIEDRIGRWYEYDLEKANWPPEDKSFARLRAIAQGREDTTEEDVSTSPPQWRIDGRRASKGDDPANTFWSVACSFTARQMQSQVYLDGNRPNEKLEIELLTGSHKRGHLFSNGSYVMSLDLGATVCPQQCWFIKEGNRLALYKFWETGSSNAVKTFTNAEWIDAEYDIDGIGVIVHYIVGKQERIDLIPPRIKTH